MKRKGTAIQAMRIRHALEEKGFTLASVGRRLGCSGQYVSQVIHGYRPGKDVRSTIAGILGYDPWARSANQREMRTSGAVPDAAPIRRRPLKESVA